MSLYYLLDKRYRLRGWKQAPWAVVDQERALARFVDRPSMEALTLCDGTVDLSLPLIPDSVRSLIKKFEERGVVHPCRYGETLLPGQEYRRYPNRFMDMVHWSVTGRCNSRCRHCYMSAPDAKYGELSHDQVLKIAEDMGKCGVLRCSLTGGEALVRRDFWDIVDAILAQGIRITVVYSNGFLVSQEFLDEWSRRGIRPEINMSFDGLGSHDWLRGIDGAEKEVRRAFELCQKNGFPTGAEMCLWKGNEHTLAETVRYLASVGCRNLRIGPISPTGAWKEGGYAETRQLSHQEVMEIFCRFLDDFYTDLPPMRIQLGHLLNLDGRRPDEYAIACVHPVSDPVRTCLCSHARNIMYISAEGRALLCMGISSLDESFQERFPLVQEKGIETCLTDSAYMQILDTKASEILAHNERCRDCNYQEICLGGCRARALEDHENDLLAIDEIVCRSFREGWIDRIVKRIEELRPGARWPLKSAYKEKRDFYDAKRKTVS